MTRRVWCAIARHWSLCLHEQSHFLGPPRLRLRRQHAPPSRPARRWTRSRRGSRRGMGPRPPERLPAGTSASTKLPPASHPVRSTPSYQAFVPAVRVLTTDLYRRAGRPGQAKPFTSSTSQTAEGQWRHVIDTAYNSSRLPDLVPPDREPASPPPPRDNSPGFLHGPRPTGNPPPSPGRHQVSRSGPPGNPPPRLRNRHRRGDLQGPGPDADREVRRARLPTTSPRFPCERLSPV